MPLSCNFRWHRFTNSIIRVGSRCSTTWAAKMPRRDASGMDSSAGLRRAPLRRFETRIGAPSVSPPAVLPLVRLAAFQSVVCARLVGFYWFPTPAVPSAFPSELAVSTVRRPPLACANEFILSYALLPFRVLPFRARPTPPGVKHLPWGWLSLFATSALGVLCATGGPFPVTFPSSAFLTPLMVFAAAGLVGLFHPTATSRVSLQGLDPLTQPSPARR
jgi:hypothetical protein